MNDNHSDHVQCREEREPHSVSVSSVKGKTDHGNYVKLVEFVADSMRMDVIELGRTGNKLIQQQGNVQYLCQEVEAADPITFTNKESFLACEDKFVYGKESLASIPCPGGNTRHMMNINE
ncbi:neurexin-1 [Trichonephila clavipes]|nr:neurexin-1 [Trichonephila clavipes]